MQIQWSADGVNWTWMADVPASGVRMAYVPAAAVQIRAIGIGAGGTLVAVVDPGFLGVLTQAQVATTQVLLSGDWNRGLKPRSINTHDLRLTEPMVQLDLPSPYVGIFTGLTSKEHAYGTPIFFPNGWRSYRYWMIGAPYPTRVNGTCTISNATPCVVTYTTHPFRTGMPVTFTTSGALPTGLISGNLYWVADDANFSANTFAVAATPGGASISTSSAGSGIHTVSLYAAKYENPVLYVSNDGENFIAAPSARAPLFDVFSITSGTDLTSYYADPYIVYDATSDKLYIIWCWFNRAGTTKSSLLISESSDGAAWSTPVEVFTSTSSTFTPNSPSLIRTSAGWSCVAIDTRDGTGTFTILLSRTTSTTPYSGWAAPAAVFSGAWSAATATHPLARQWWHQFSVGTADGEIAMMATDSGSGGGAAYTLHSCDGGLTYSAQPFSAWDSVTAQGTWYRPGLCVMNDGANASLRMYASRINPASDIATTGFFMKTAPIRDGFTADALQRMMLRDMVHRQLAAPVALRAAGLLNWDSFNRADGALGNSDAGIGWTNVDANTITISTNRATNGSPANCRAVVDVGSQNFDFEVQILTPGTSWALLFSYVDSSNFWRFGNIVVPSGLQRIVGGSVSTVPPSAWTAKVTISASDIVRINKRGARYTIFYNDRPIDSFTDFVSPTATRVGLQASGASATFFENFIVRVG